MYFQYDISGMPLGLIYNGTQYFYITNQMGDVIAITDITGTVVGKYEYDAWGAVILADTDVAKTNPIRYRGYYYDNETGYYYLQSRYYNTNICRFINSDSLENTMVQKEAFSGTNVFAYCCNSPINYSDIDGHWVLSLGVEFEASAIWGIYGGLSVNFDGRGNIVIAYCAGVTFTTNVTASLYGYIAYNHRASSATSISGWGISMGVSYSSGVKIGGYGGLNIGLNDKSISGSVSATLGAGVSIAPIPYISIRGGYTGILYKTTFSNIGSKIKTYSKKGVKMQLSKKSHYVNIYIPTIKRNIQVYKTGKIYLSKRC